MGSGADKDKNKKKGNIRTLDQKPKEVPAFQGIASAVVPEKKEECCGSDCKVVISEESRNELISRAEDMLSNCAFDNNDDVQLVTCKKTLQRFIDRIKEVK